MSNINYNNLPKTIISPFTGDTLDLVYTKKDALNNDDSLLVIADKSSGDNETFWNGDFVEAMYLNQETRECIDLI